MEATGCMGNTGEYFKSLYFQGIDSAGLFVCLTFSVLYLNSDNVLRREACLVARVRHHLLLHCKPKTSHTVYQSFLQVSISSLQSLLGIWASTDRTNGAA